MPSARRSAIGHVELYGAGDGARIALAYAARFGDRVRALVLDGGPRATLFSGDGRGEAHALARALGKGEPAVARLAARLRTRPLHSHGRIDDDVLARIAANGSAGTLGDLPGAATAALHGDPVPLARLAAASAPGTCAPGGAGAGERLQRQCRARPQRADRRRAVHRRDLACAHSGSRRVCAGRSRPSPIRCSRPVPRSPAPPRSCSPVSSTCAHRPQRCARSRASCPRATFVRVRGAGALPALADPGGCAATIARTFLQTRGRVRPACASRRAQALGARAFPPSLAAAPPALHDATAHGRDHSTLADRRAATAAALGVADALAVRGGARRARARRGPARRLGARDAPRHARDAHAARACASCATRRSTVSSPTTRRPAACSHRVTLRAADGSLRPFVLTWSTHQIGGLGTARGSSAGRPLLLVLQAALRRASRSARARAPRRARPPARRRSHRCAHARSRRSRVPARSPSDRRSSAPGTRR